MKITALGELLRVRGEKEYTGEELYRPYSHPPARPTATHHLLDLELQRAMQVANFEDELFPSGGLSAARLAEIQRENNADKEKYLDSRKVLTLANLIPEILGGLG